MHLEDIVKKTNVSTLFILPIFSEIAKDITYKYTKVPYRIIPLFYEHGLVKTYCYSYLSKDNNSLFLVFRKKDVLRRMTNTNRPGQTVNNLLLTSRFFNGLEIVGDFYIFNLSIPAEYYDDVDLIKKGKYSLVSEQYRELLVISGKVLMKHILNNDLSHTIVKQNLAIKIVTKDPSVKEDFEKTLLCSIPDNVEFYEKFSIKKETLTEKILNDLITKEEV